MGSQFLVCVLFGIGRAANQEQQARNQQVMMFYDKVEAFLSEAETLEIPLWNVAPPVYRFFWWLGIEIPPPSFLSRKYVVVLEGLFFSIIFLLFFFQFCAIVEAAVCAAGTGIMYALIAGIQHVDISHQRGHVPSWEAYIPGINNLDP